MNAGAVSQPSQPDAVSLLSKALAGVVILRDAEKNVIRLMKLSFSHCASSSFIMQLINSCLQQVAEGVKGCKAQIMAELIRTQSGRSPSLLACSQVEWLLLGCSYGTVCSSDICPWNEISTTLPVFLGEIFVFFPLMFNTHIPYVNSSLFPSALPTADRERYGLSLLINF